MMLMMRCGRPCGGIDMIRPRERTAFLLTRFAVAVTLILLESCGETKEIAQMPAHDEGSYFPLREGHRLEFRMTMDGRNVGMTQEVRGTRVIGDRTYSILLTSFSDGIIKNDPTYYREDASGVYAGDPDHSRENNLYLPSPARPDTEWTLESLKWVTHNSATSIPEIEVEGRIYRNCLQVVTESRSKSPPGSIHRGTAWYAPGIGTVKLELKSESGVTTGVLVRHVR